MLMDRDTVSKTKMIVAASQHPNRRGHRTLRVGVLAIVQMRLFSRKIPDKLTHGTDLRSVSMLVLVMGTRTVEGIGCALARDHRDFKQESPDKRKVTPILIYKSDANISIGYQNPGPGHTTYCETRLTKYMLEEYKRT